MNLLKTIITIISFISFTSLQVNCSTITPSPSKTLGWGDQLITLSPQETPLNFNPSFSPTESSSFSPTESSSFSPTESPSLSPTESPSFSPTKTPTLSPTESPSLSPTKTPTLSPTESPSLSPTKTPTLSPTESPSLSPTKTPTLSPTESPSLSPTKKPTDVCDQLGCTYEMITNDWCDLQCNIPECNNDNGKCKGYIHIEYVGSKIGLDPRIMPGIYNLAQKFNEFIRPESQLSSKTLSSKICNRYTNLPYGIVSDQLVIVAYSKKIDGIGGTIGQAGPCGRQQRSDGTWVTINGRIIFDVDDIGRYIEGVLFKNLVMHEIGHVLGIGTLWANFNLIENPRWTGNVENPNNFPEYTGVKGNNEWNIYGGVGQLPIEYNGGRGTADGHWKYDKLRGEIMTGWLSRSESPVSKITLGSLDDMGIKVYYDKADDWDINEIHNDEIELLDDFIYPDYMELYFYNGDIKIDSLSESVKIKYDKLILLSVISLFYKILKA
jgi:hypothetical protein